jgi:hypothetical protein
MAEITPGRAKAEKEILLFEDFEAIAHHAFLDLSPGADVRRSPDAAHSGHAGLKFFIPAVNNAYARAQWTTKPPRTNLIALRIWFQCTPFPIHGFLTFYMLIQFRNSYHEIRIRYNVTTNKWQFRNESGVYEDLTEITTIPSSEVWVYLTLEVDLARRRIIAMHLNEEFNRLNRAYYVTSMAAPATAMDVGVELSTTTASTGTAYIDDLIVQEL